MKYLWDTNIAIYYLQRQFPITAERFIDDALEASEPVLSVISEIELMSWKASSEKDTALLNQFISHCLVLELERDIKVLTASLRREYKIKLPDAIIAATAMTYDLILLTRNITDFKNLPEIQLINPFEQ